MKKILSFSGAALLVAVTLAFSGCTREHKIAVVAHTGFWKCEQGGETSNSIASLTAAQDNAFWGSECDINLTADDVIVVAHGPKFKGMLLRENTYADSLKLLTLKNGEPVPTLDQYLDQLVKAKTVLVLELKKQLNEERENLMTDKAIEALKAHGVYDPKRVIFISFSHFICQKIAKEHPAFTNQYLSGDIAPADLKKEGINGIDYNYKVLHEHPEWIKEAQDLGMSVNVWTIDDEEKISEMIGLGVDQITTNEPLLTRELIRKLEKKELPVPKK